MNIEECLNMMVSLRDAYAQVSVRGDISSTDIYRLKHSLTEFELVLISMKKSVDIMLKKLEVRKQQK